MFDKVMPTFSHKYPFLSRIFNNIRKKQTHTQSQRSPAPKDAFGVARAGSLPVQDRYHAGRAIAEGEASIPPHQAPAQRHRLRCDPIQKDYASGACASVQKEALSVFSLFKRLTRLEVSIMAINEDTKLEELQRIKGELKELLPLLSKWRVEELQKLVSEHYTKKWRKR